jgi:hypothetical protein
MGVTVDWDNDSHTVIRYDFISSWTWDDFQAATHTAFALRQNVNTPVDIIHNLEQTAHIPEGALSWLLKLREKSPNRGVVVFAAGQFHDYYKNLLSIFRQITKGATPPVIVVETLDEARAVLDKLRPLQVG